MLERVWRKENPATLLGGIQVGTVTKENSMKIPQKTKNRIAIWSSNVTLRHAAAAAAKSLQSCPTLCDPVDGSPPGSAAPGILQARTLDWVVISFSNAWKWKVKSQSPRLSSPTLSDPMDCNLPGSSIHGIFQTRILEWVALPSLSLTKGKNEALC